MRQKTAGARRLVAAVDSPQRGSGGRPSCLPAQGEGQGLPGHQHAAGAGGPATDRRRAHVHLQQRRQRGAERDAAAADPAQAGAVVPAGSHRRPATGGSEAQQQAATRCAGLREAQGNGARRQRQQHPSGIQEMGPPAPAALTATHARCRRMHPKHGMHLKYAPKGTNAAAKQQARQRSRQKLGGSGGSSGTHGGAPGLRPSA